MLSEIAAWKNDPSKELSTSFVEFCAQDFYGPIVRIELKRYGDGKVRAFPKESHCENVSHSMSDLNLLIKACEELVEAIGPFKLCIPLFEVDIDRAKGTNKGKGAKGAIMDKLLNIRMF